MPHQREQAPLLPSVGLRELRRRPSFSPDPLVRGVGVRVRQRHRHVHVGGAGLERAVEDRHHEPRVDGVQHVGDAVGAAELGDGRRVGRVDRRGGELPGPRP